MKQEDIQRAVELGIALEALIESKVDLELTNTISLSVGRSPVYDAKIKDSPEAKTFKDRLIKETDKRIKEVEDQIKKL